MATLGSITISQGCDYSLHLTVTEPTGIPMDLTDHDVRFRISDKSLKSRYVDITGPVNSVEGTAGGIAFVSNPEEGKVTIYLNPHTPEQLPTNNEEGEESRLQANNIYSVVVIEQGTGKITKVLQGDCYTEAEL
jgi:hypothetical protein